MSSSTITGFKLSPQQRQIWRQQSALGEAALTVQSQIRLQGPLDEQRLQQALEAVMARHDILRTGFQETPGLTLPLQVVQATGEVMWQRFDLTRVAPVDQDSKLMAQRQAERQQMPTSGQPPLQAALFVLGEQQYRLLLTLSALWADLPTCRILLEQLSRHYGGQDLSLTEAAVQYAEFAAWQDELLTEADDEAQAAGVFWQQMLASVQPTASPLRCRDIGPDPFNAQVYSVELAPETQQALQGLSATPAAVLLTGWLILLWRQTEQSGITLGVACDGRQDEDLADACGPFTRTLPFQAQLTEALTFSALLRQVDQQWSDLTDWQDYFPVDQGASSMVLPISFEWVALAAPQTAAGVEFQLEPVWAYSAPSELKLSVTYQGEQLSLKLHYSDQVFSQAAIAALGTQLTALLTHISQEPTAAIGRLRLIEQTPFSTAAHSPAELDQTIERPALPCIHQRFEQQAEQTPTALAIVCEDGALTYEALNRRANQLAHYLLQLGAGPEVPVALYLERSPDLLVTLLAILKTGSAYLPLDLALPGSGIIYRLQDAQVPILVTRAAFLEEMEIATTQVVCLDRDRDHIAQEPNTNPASAVTTANLAYLIYTSGSTGQPKGVAVEHRQLLHYVDGIIERLALPSAAHYASVSTVAADLGHTMIFPSLCQGGTLHLIATERASDAQALADYVEQSPIDCLKIVPSHLKALLQGPQPEKLLPRQRLVLGGEACPWSLMVQIQSLAPGCRLFNHYGPTETTVGALTYALEPAAWVQRTAATVPIGQAIAPSTCYLLDPDLQPVPIGIPGEVYIGGQGVARGYLQRPGLTAARFVPDPFSAHPGARLYRTGDLARLHPDGNLEFLRRRDLQVKLHGFRIELGEIEAQLAQHPQVQAVSAVVHEDDSENPILVAYVVPQAGETLTPSDFRPFLGQRLPHYMIPSLFVTLSALPLTPNGKVDRQALPAPERVRPELAKQYVAPRTPTEEAISAIWVEVLGMETVGVNDNFFELGGHSLLATQVLSRLRETFQVALPLRQLFEAHTVAAVAEVVESALLAEIEAMTDSEAEALVEQTSAGEQ